MAGETLLSGERIKDRDPRVRDQVSVCVEGGALKSGLGLYYGPGICVASLGSLSSWAPSQ